MQNCKRKKLQSVQALRGLAFLAVFTGHAGLSNAQWSAVSLFFVLSGFLMVYNYLPDFREQDKPSFWKNIRFSYKKIQNLYMLHVVTTLLVLPITIVKTFGGGTTITDAVIKVTFRLGVNLLLIQSWFPVSEIRNSFNMVSWYLSVCAFLYFLFPWIIRKVAKYQGKMQAACNLGFMVLVQFAAGYLLNEMVHMYGGNENLVQGLTYNFPLYRMFDFVIGCDLGYLYFYSDKGKKGKYHFVTEKEAAVLCLEIWNLALVHYYSQIAWSGWWWRTNLHILTSCLLIYIFVKNQGGLTRFCNNRYLIYLGNISGVTFLIHELVLRYIGFIFRYCGIELNRWVLATIVFLLTVVLAQMWQKRSFLQNGNENIV